MRVLTDKGPKFGGGVDTPSLCGRVGVGLGWDLNVKFDPDSSSICSKCKELLDVIRTYVVESDHAILYAGQNFSEARSVICGFNKIYVWEAGLWLGYMDVEGAWIFKTKHLDTASS